MFVSLRNRLCAIALTVNVKAKHALSEALQLALFAGGLVSISYGAWMMYRPLGFILAGVFAVWIAFLREIR